MFEAVKQGGYSKEASWRRQQCASVVGSKARRVVFYMCVFLVAKLSNKIRAEPSTFSTSSLRSRRCVLVMRTNPLASSTHLRMYVCILMEAFVSVVSASVALLLLASPVVVTLSVCRCRAVVSCRAWR